MSYWLYFAVLVPESLIIFSLLISYDHPRDANDILQAAQRNLEFRSQGKDGAWLMASVQSLNRDRDMQN